MNLEICICNVKGDFRGEIFWNRCLCDGMRMRKGVDIGGGGGGDGVWKEEIMEKLKSVREGCYGEEILEGVEEGKDCCYKEMVG